MFVLMRFIVVVGRVRLFVSCQNKIDVEMVFKKEIQTAVCCTLPVLLEHEPSSLSTTCVRTEGGSFF